MLLCGELKKKGGVKGDPTQVPGEKTQMVCWQWDGENGGTSI